MTPATLAGRPAGTVLAVAHRAGNSLPQLRSAISRGAHVIEADVHRHRGRLEVRHLKTMGPLPWLWDRWEICSARASRLLLPDLLLAVDGTATFMLDLKGRHPGLGADVADALRRHAPERPVMVCSRYWPSLRPFAGLSWVSTLRSARNRRELARLLRSGPGRHHGASVHRSLLDHRTLSALHAQVPLVMTWPVNDAVALGGVLALRGAGTLGVITDNPSVLTSVIARSG